MSPKINPLYSPCPNKIWQRLSARDFLLKSIVYLRQRKIHVSLQYREREMLAGSQLKFEMVKMKNDGQSDVKLHDFTRNKCYLYIFETGRTEELENLETLGEKEVMDSSKEMI
ncbi:hypothetical protein QYM36_013673 [Artemia franciscana]|uniref:Uncharacterized protein n=1 Tax=Artemia franciscana TaxID=6661 RepID=A0AA88HH01_ARTSF|nr:hypothetical protein QYM36_013673 [Artemia franciscana]